MKKLKILLTLFVLISISCSDDESSDSDNEVKIIGKWEITEIKLVTTSDLPDGPEEEQEILNTLQKCNPTPTWEFFSNGELERRELEIDLEDDSCFVGDVFEMDTWERIGNNTIRINDDTDTQNEFKITSKGNNQVKMSGEEAEVGTVAKITISLSRL